MNGVNETKIRRRLLEGSGVTEKRGVIGEGVTHIPDVLSGVVTAR